MKSVLWGLFQPISNRHYTSKKASVGVYAANYVIIVVVCIAAALLVDELFWLVLIGIIILAVIDYVVFDAFFDKLSWKLFWRYFYQEPTKVTHEHQLLKNLEKDPSPENQRRLADHIKQSQR